MQASGETIIIDGKGHRLGRLASKVAKLLLQGRRVVIVNAEEVLVTGNKSATMNRYLMLSRRKWLSSLSVVKVWYPNRADRILWYTIARMLPRKRPRGRSALSRLRVYIGLPEEYATAEKIVIDEALHKGEVNRSGKVVRTMRLAEISALLSGGLKKT